jgi:hypothetical protein
MVVIVVHQEKDTLPIAVFVAVGRENTTPMRHKAPSVKATFMP